MSNLATAKSVLNVLKGRVAERQSWLHNQAATEGTDEALIAAAELDQVLRIIDEEIARVDRAV